jgi:hypothetical protein
VSRGNEVKAALEKTIEAFGRLDFAFNNAGIEQPVTSAANLTEEEWDGILDINLRGVFRCSQREESGDNEFLPERAFHLRPVAAVAGAMTVARCLEITPSRPMAQACRNSAAPFSKFSL